MERKVTRQILFRLANRNGESKLQGKPANFRNQTAVPMEMLAILRRGIASQYLVAIPQKREKDEASAPRELILSSYLS